MSSPAEHAPALAAAPSPSGLPGRRFLLLNAAALGVGVLFLGAGLAWPPGAAPRRAASPGAAPVTTGVPRGRGSGSK